MISMSFKPIKVALIRGVDVMERVEDGLGMKG